MKLLGLEFGVAVAVRAVDGIGVGLGKWLRLGLRWSWGKFGG